MGHWAQDQVYISKARHLERVSPNWSTSSWKEHHLTDVRIKLTATPDVARSSRTLTHLNKHSTDSDQLQHKHSTLLWTHSFEQDLIDLGRLVLEQEESARSVLNAQIFSREKPCLRYKQKVFLLWKGYISLAQEKHALAVQGEHLVHVDLRPKNLAGSRLPNSIRTQRAHSSANRHYPTCPSAYLSDSQSGNFVSGTSNSLEDQFPDWAQSSLA